MYQNTKSKIWDIFVYQFHIKAKKGIQRNPTPEGIHKDSHIFISMHMIGQPNIESGTSYIYDENRKNKRNSFERKFREYIVG